MDTKDGSVFGQVESDKAGLDFVNMPYHGHAGINNEHHYIGDILQEVGQTVEYIHDLGVRWCHTITVLASEDTMSTHCTILAGKGACPPEDANGLDIHHDVYLYLESREDNGRLTVLFYTCH